ncbi:MAG: nuclear transport factor 2 family protein [Trueperaceae bacterium]
MHPNEAPVRAFFDAAAKRDINGIMECWADDVVLHYHGQNPVAGTYRGKQEVLGAYGKMAQLTGGTFRRVELHDLLATDGHVVALARVGAEREGRSLEWNGIDVYHVRDGKIVEIWIHVVDQYAVDAFLA